MAGPDRYFIISVDGGGCRGVIPSMLLQSLGNAALLKANLFAGTSTGSIIAGGLACGVSIDDITTVYQKPQACQTIFTPYHSITVPVVSNLLFPRYKSDGVRSVVEAFPETKKPVSAAGRHCYLPSFLIDGNEADGPQWFATAFHNLGEAAGFGGFAHVPMVDAIMASAAAPLYFPPHTIGSLLFVDGGVCDNNPAMSALAAATHAGIVGPRGVPIDRVSILSLGTGRAESAYPPDPSGLLPPYGELGWMWPAARGATTPQFPVMEATFDGVAQLNDLQVQSIVGRDNYRRTQLDFGTASFPMDDCSKVHGTDGLIERTERYIKSDKWQKISEWALSRLG
jgi:hypothetical protein